MTYQLAGASAEPAQPLAAGVQDDGFADAVASAAATSVDAAAGTPTGAQTGASSGAESQPASAPGVGASATNPQQDQQDELRAEMAAGPSPVDKVKQQALDTLFDQAGATGFAVGAIFTIGDNRSPSALRMPDNSIVPKGTSVAIAAFMPMRPALEGDVLESAAKSSVFVFLRPPNETEYTCYTLNPSTGRLTAGHGNAKPVPLGPLGTGVQFTNHQTGLVGVGTDNPGAMIGSTNVGFVKDVPPLSAALNRGVREVSGEAADAVLGRIPLLRSIGGDALAGLLDAADAATGKVLVGPTFTLNAVVDADGDFNVNVHGTKVRLSAAEVAQEAARRSNGLDAAPVVDMLGDLTRPSAATETLAAAADQAEIVGHATFGWEALRLAPKLGLPFADDLLGWATKALPFAIPGAGIASIAHLTGSAIHGHTKHEIARIEKEEAFNPQQALPGMVRGFDPRYTNITYDTANLAQAINNAAEAGAAEPSSIRASWQAVLDGETPLPDLTETEMNAAKLVAATLLGREDEVKRLSELLYPEDNTVSGVRPRALNDPRYQIAD